MTRSDSDRHGEHRSEGEAAFDALLARAVDMPTDEAALAARIAARIAAEGSRPAPGARIVGTALDAALAWSLALALG